MFHVGNNWGRKARTWPRNPAQFVAMMRASRCAHDTAWSQMRAVCLHSEALKGSGRSCTSSTLTQLFFLGVVFLQHFPTYPDLPASVHSFPFPSLLPSLPSYGYYGFSQPPPQFQSLLDQLTELKNTAYWLLLFIYYIGYESGRTKWNRFTGQVTGVGTQNFHTIYPCNHPSTLMCSLT